MVSWFPSQTCTFTVTAFTYATGSKTWPLVEALVPLLLEAGAGEDGEANDHKCQATALILYSSILASNASGALVA